MAYDPNEPAFSGPGPYVNGDPRLLTPEYQAWLKAHGNPNAGNNTATTSHANVGGVPDGSQHDVKGNVIGPPPLVTDPLRGGYNERTPETEAWKKFYDKAPSSFDPVAFSNTQQQNSRGAQTALLQQYHALAAGDRNSLAQQQLRQSIDAARSQALSGAANVRGVSAGAALRGAQNQQQQIGLQGQSDSKLLMLQEQAQARQALMNMYAQQRVGDINAANSQADVYGQNQGLNDSFSLFNAGQSIGTHEADRRADLDQIRAQQGLDRDLRANLQRGTDVALGAASTAARGAVKMYQNLGISPNPIDDAFNGG